VAFLAALTKCGVRPKKGIEVVQNWLVAHDLGILPKFWVMYEGNPDENFEFTYEPIDEVMPRLEPPDPDDEQWNIARPPQDRDCAAIVHVAAIADRVTWATQLEEYDE
jgi:hypothetical protein